MTIYSNAFFVRAVNFLCAVLAKIGKMWYNNNVSVRSAITAYTDTF